MKVVRASEGQLLRRAEKRAGFVMGGIKVGVVIFPDWAECSANRIWYSAISYTRREILCQHKVVNCQLSMVRHEDLRAMIENEYYFACRG